MPLCGYCSLEIPPQENKQCCQARTDVNKMLLDKQNKSIQYEKDFHNVEDLWAMLEGFERPLFPDWGISVYIKRMKDKLVSDYNEAIEDVELYKSIISELRKKITDKE